MSALPETVPLRVVGVPAEYVLKIWPDVSEMLERVVLPHTGYALHDVLNELLFQRWQLWLISGDNGEVKAVSVTRIEARPLERVLWVQYLAGEDMHEWLDEWIAVQDDYAKQNGCRATEFAGRKGWHGLNHKYPEYQPIFTTFRKEYE